ASDAIAQRVLTAYVLCGRPRRRPDTPSRAVQVQAWLAAVEAADVGKVAGTDRLAWAAYQQGDMKLAARWLDVAEADSGIAQWLRVKLLLRAGRLDEAAERLATVSRLFPVEAEWRQRALGEFGVLQLARRQYVEALDALVRGGYWIDAAYVAERVLTSEELVAYVDRNWPEVEGEKDARDAGFGKVAAERAGHRIRYLLARRLARTGQWHQARAYYPEKLRARLDAYIEAIRGGYVRERSRPERAASFMAAARIARHEGMELLGTEVEPDWFVFDGLYAPGAISAVRAHWRRTWRFGSSAEEYRRVRRHKVSPERRRHYRYVAADHAWSAVELMPDNSDETARALIEAGSWLKARDPKAADRFYKALVRRCRKTDLGKEAARLRWFPKLPKE
ncbi:MAG: hypothetical protein ACTSYK_04370, partial [Alphaproteobacteria bacterium]